MITSQVSQLEFSGNASTSTPYALASLRFDSNSWLEVVEVTSAGAVVPLNPGADYVVTGNGATASASIVTSGRALPGSSILRVSRRTPSTQEAGLTIGGSIPSSTLERMADKLTMAAQDLARIVSEGEGRSLRLPVGETAQDIPADRDGMLLYFGENGSVQVIPPSSVLALSGGVVPNGQGVPPGGAEGDILARGSNSAGDWRWVPKPSNDNVIPPGEFATDAEALASGEVVIGQVYRKPGGGIAWLQEPFPVGTAIHLRGNSLTLGADAGAPYYLIQYGVSALLTAAGVAPASMVTYAADGLDFQGHADPSSPNYAASLASVNSGTWDFAFIQNLTSAANDLADHLTYGEAMYNQYIARNSECQVILYETPAYAFENASYPSVFESPYYMRIATRAAYDQLAEDINSAHTGNKRVKVSPVGSAMYYAGACLPPAHRQYRALHAADDLLHLNGDGYVQAVLCHYVTLTGANPSGLLSSSQWAAIEAAMTSKPVQSRAWHEAHAYKCAGLGRYPLIMIQDPGNVTAVDGGNAPFAVFADGSGPVSYQWMKNGVPIPGATLSAYTAMGVSSSDNGAKFKCICSNSEGIVESLEGTLTVGEPEPVPEILINFTRFGFTVGTVGGKTYNDRQAPSGDQLPTIAGQSWDLVSTANAATSIRLHLDSAGTDGGANNIGPTGLGTWPDNASSTFWVGGAGPSNIHTLRLSGFSPGAQMLFEIRGWRALDGSNRQTRVVVTDASGDHNIDYNAGANSADLVSITVTADASGEITFKPQMGAGNSVNFFYYGILRIAPVP